MTHPGAGELLHCPFCGQQPFERLEKNPNGAPYPDHWIVWCENLECPASPETFENTREESRAAWNTRSSERAEIALSESQRHAIAHAKYLCDQATPENPEVCFDFELVRMLLSVLSQPTAREEKDKPDWPPARTALDLPNGTTAFGSTGQSFVVKDGQWRRAALPSQEPKP